MSAPALAQLQAPAKEWVRRRKDGAGIDPTLDPVQQRVLELQRDAGNAAVTQLVGAKASEAVPEDPVTLGQAKAIFEQGAAAYDKGEFGKAYDQFTRAYELSPRPGIVFSRAQALRRLGGRTEEAIQLYQQYLAMGESNRATQAAQFVKELQAPESTGDVDKNLELSKSIFEKGARFYEANDFSHAYDEFTRSYELTERPPLLFSRAQAMRRMGGRREQAMELFQQYLDTGDTKRAADAKAILDDLRTKGISK